MADDYVARPADGLSASALAFVGDAVFTLYVRESLCGEYDYKSGRLTKLAAGIVSARTQARIAAALADCLSGEEKEILRRCRNTHTQSRAKNATAAEYHKATGLEGLIGYLYLCQGFAGRLKEILQKCLETGKEIIKEINNEQGR